MPRSKIKDPRRVHDFWTRKAKAQNYPARSVFKLEEADQKFRLLRPGAKILDLGSAPGSWTLYAAERVGPKGLIVSVDLQRPQTKWPDTVRFIQADVLELSVDDLAPVMAFDVVISDMAPKTTGMKSVDQARSVALSQAAVDLARNVLKNKGILFFKIFQGPEIETIFSELRQEYKTVRRFKPKSSRAISPEIFGLGLGFKKRDIGGEPSVGT